MNADANGYSSAALRILMTPDTRPPSSTWPPTPDARAPSRRDSSDLSPSGQGRRRRRKRHADHHLIDADHHMQSSVKHPDGGERTVADTQADERAQRVKIVREKDMGSHKHDRLPRWLRRIPGFVLLFNFVLLLYSFAGITNVDWQSPLSMDLAFASALAGMVTVLAFAFLAFAGYRLRSLKDHDGMLDVHALDALTKGVAGAAMVVIAVLAMVMYVRMHSEVRGALGGHAGQTAWVIPLSLAVVSLAANCLVVLIPALDGSDEVARLDKLAAATRRPARKAHKLRVRAAQQAHR